MYALLGERAPPVPIEDPKYKQRRSLPTVKVSWHRSRFVNQARGDGLLLSHWHKKTEPIGGSLPVANSINAPQTTEADGGTDVTLHVTPQAETKEDTHILEDGDYKFAKYNLQIQSPKYEGSLHDQYLQHPDWSREETEYLIDLQKEYYGKWPLIVDRYDFKPTTAHNVELGTDPATQAAPAHRSMEDLKHRYYTVYALLMSAHTPLTNMTSAEFDLHEKYGKFNPNQEADRKRHKELIMTRSDEDKKEEEHLLAELRRIYHRQKRNEEERAELRDRLDHSTTDPAADVPPYKTSAEINVLFQKMMAKDKNAKQRRMDGGIAGSPANMHGAGQTPGSGATKRGSIAVGLGQGTPGASRKQLTPREEVRFGVTHHDRLTSGVTFRSDKIAKVRQAKSQVQTQKIAAILAELQVPDMFQMPSSAVVSGMEKLVQKVGVLIEARKVKEKDENDLKVARERKKMRESELASRPVDADGNVQNADVDMSHSQDAAGENEDEETKVDQDEEEEGEDEEEQDQRDEDNEEDEEEDEEQQEDAGEAEQDEDDDDEDGQEETFADAEETFGDDRDEQEERQDSEEAAEEAADRSDGEEEEEEEEEEEGEEEEEAQEIQSVRTRGNKRSASVLSAGSSAVTAKRMKSG